MEEVLVTGSSGLIGRILVPELVENGFIVYKLDVVDSGPGVDFRVDISDYEELMQVDIKPDNIIHLAADSNPRTSWKSVLNNNIIGTRNVFEFSREKKVKKVVFASSNHVTGMYEGFPPNLHKKKKISRLISVRDEIRPDGYYGTGKAFGEALARQFYELYGISSICLRIGTVLEDDDPTKDERHMKTWLSHRDMLQLFIKSIRSKVGFGIYYGVSNNKGRFWDISNGVADLDYRPADDASLLTS